jgi:phenylpyruvate tautomerase PptA (4-oxalocrotonate tautomerase family)
MPFVQISLALHHTEKVKKDISHSIHESLVDAFRIPVDDYFQVIQAIQPGNLLYAENYLGIPHSDNLVYIQIVARGGRTVEQKKELYQSIAKKIAALTPISIDDVFIVLVENELPDWSFGRGIAQYV